MGDDGYGGDVAESEVYARISYSYDPCALEGRALVLEKGRDNSKWKGCYSPPLSRVPRGG